MSHWKGCFKLAILVGLGLKWNHISKDKKWLEKQRPLALASGRQQGEVVQDPDGVDGVQPDQGETSRAWGNPAREPQKNRQWENCLKRAKGKEALICKHFNCKVVYILSFPKSWQGKCYCCFPGYVAGTETDRVFHLVAGLLNYKKDKSLSQKQ